MIRRHRFLILLALFMISVPLSAQEPEGNTAVVLRPDAPPYAVHGPYPVGMKSLVIEDGGDPQSVSVWYPALNPAGDEEAVTYSVRWKIEGLYPDLASDVAGHALLDAAPDVDNGPYPLVVFSHGYGGDAVIYSSLLEHLASYGFVVAAPDHVELFSESDAAIPTASILRPQVITRVLDYASEEANQSDALPGMIDMEHVAVVGQDFGGFTALASANARMDINAFQERCAALAPDDPNQHLCVLAHTEEIMVEAAGLDAEPEGLWPSAGDARVDAVATLAGDTYVFGEDGMADVVVPVLAIGGTADTFTPYDWGVRQAYDSVSSDQKILVSVENADHHIFNVSCGDSPSIVDELGAFFYCSDPVWDMDRAHDLINHFTTAFLLDVLTGNEDAHAALASESVTFPGITYEAAGF